MSLKFVSRDPINNTLALVQIMAWRQPGDKPFFEPLMFSTLTHICVIKPQRVKLIETKFICICLQIHACNAFVKNTTVLTLLPFGTSLNIQPNVILVSDNIKQKVTHYTRKLAKDIFGYFIILYVWCHISIIVFFCWFLEHLFRIVFVLHYFARGIHR